MPRNAGGKDAGQQAWRRRCRVQATPVPSAISVNMLRLRVTSDCQPRSKNGQPAQSTTGVANASCSQFDMRRLRSVHADRRSGRPSRARTRAAPAPAPIQNRRVMSASSGLGRCLGGDRDPARAPCRRSGRSRGRLAGSPDASGRCRSCLRERARPMRHRRRDISPGRRRISCGIRPSRNNTCGLHARRGASLCADRHPFRKRGLLPSAHVSSRAACRASSSPCRARCCECVPSCSVAMSYLACSIPRAGYRLA